MTDAPPRPRWAERKPERNHVVAAYRFLLGRDPESEAAIEAQLAACPTIGALRERLLNTAECRAQFDPTAWRPMALGLPPEEVEAQADPAQFAALMARVGRAWTWLGQEQPHWSVVSEERFRPDRLGENLGAFAATGEESCRLVLAQLARHDVTPALLPRAVEYGCGVGRMSLPLSRRFAALAACDISPAHLGIARAAGAEAGRGNITWWQATAEAPMPPPPWDLWFSYLVLQHNPPPITRHLLATAFAGLAPGGVALFQLFTHIKGYRFRIAEYLAQPEVPRMELHALPQAEVFALAAAAGLEVLEVREDSHATTRHPGRYLSHSFVLRRPRG
jgi:SAM-dependent methyltransferase